MSSINRVHEKIVLHLFFLSFATYVFINILYIFFLTLNKSTFYNNKVYEVLEELTFTNKKCK